MSKVLFVNGNLYGHLNPTLPIIAEYLVSYKPTGNHPFNTLLEYMINYDRVMIPTLFGKNKTFAI